MRAEPLTPDDARTWAAFEAALLAAGLPTGDLADEGQRFFSFEACAAFGGFALHGPIVLLRSIVVAPAHRGSGLGGRALAALLDEAHGQGAAAAWLLTTTADGFFARHGFTVVDRGAAPPAIAASSQFTGLCPASAVLMRREPLGRIQGD